MSNQRAPATRGDEKQEQSSYVPNANETYMSRQQLEYFLAKLKFAEADISTRIKSKAIALFLDSRSPSSDYVDRSAADAIEFTDVLSMNTLQNQLTTVKECIRMATLNLQDPPVHSRGRYGYCGRTGQEIGLQRLMVQPDTLLCTEAKLEAERRQSST